eukprot:Rhum_TRINITY_DN15442_c11_g1::Rhum_TRINITY_DN15442_c11_g1_i1::g.157602::m.157602/K05917/CYP51; sterol 14-demethylase
MLVPLLGLALLMGLISIIRYNFLAPKDAPPVHKSFVPFAGSIVPFGVNFLKFVQGGTAQHGKIWTTKLMGNRVTIVGHRDLHEDFFRPRNDVLSPSEVYRFMKPVFGPGVVYDATHARMREQLGFVSEQLSLAQLRKCVPKIQNQVRAVLAKDWGDSGTLNLLDAMSSLLISTASLCLFGSVPADPGVLSRILHDIESGINPIAVFIHWMPSFGLFRQRAARQEFEVLAQKILDDKRVEMGDKQEPEDIIESLLLAVYRDGTEMTDVERIGIMIGVIFAGQHTSLITSSWAIAFLSDPKNAAMKKRHTEEMEHYSHGEGCERELDFDGLAEMHYTDAVIKEVLRLNPPLIMLMRKVLQPLKIGGYTVPEGDTIAVSPLASMRSTDVFENADTFDPSRWTEKNEGGGALDFIGFGGGTHRCLGERFGTLQTKVVLSTILNDYDIELVSGTVPQPDYTTMVVGPTASQSLIRYKKKQQ